MQQQLATGLRSTSRATRWVIGLALIGALCAGCAEEELFGSCPFDSTITENCTDDAGTARFTCVVEEHPQCLEDICLMWKSSNPFCTRRCDPTLSECPWGSTCSPYSTGKSFCVPNDFLVN